MRRYLIIIALEFLLLPQLLSLRGTECIMQEPTVLRTTKIGGGFVKEDVMQYLDELNSKIVGLEEELANAKDSGPTDPQEIVKYRKQIDSLQEKLNASNNALRTAKTELDAAKKQHEQDQALINQLRAGKGGAAPAAGQAQPQANAAELAASKAEIDKLKAQAKSYEEKLAAAQAAAQKNAAAGANSNANTPANAAQAAELQKIKSDMARITSELSAKNKELAAKTNELENKTREAAEKSDAIAKLTKEKESAVAEKNAEISKLNDEIASLKEAASDPTAQMGLLFAEAQKTVNNLKNQAKIDAEKTTKEANETAERVKREANEEAAKTIESANTTAAACVKEANDQAAKTIKEANEQAEQTIKEANSHADTVNEMSAAVRKLLINEIESVSTKFSDIAGMFTSLSTQASDRMNEAQSVFDEARKNIDDNESADVKKTVAPTASFEAKKAPSAAVKPSDKPSASYQNQSAQSQTSKPAYTQTHENKPSKKASNFNFDMSELLKAAEEEAARNPQE